MAASIIDVLLSGSSFPDVMFPADALLPLLAGAFSCLLLMAHETNCSACDRNSAFSGGGGRVRRSFGSMEKKWNCSVSYDGSLFVAATSWWAGPMPSLSECFIVLSPSIVSFNESRRDAGAYYF